MVQDRRSTFEPYWVGRAGRTTGGTREGLPLLRGLPGGQEAGLGPWNSGPCPSRSRGHSQEAGHLHEPAHVWGVYAVHHGPARQLVPLVPRAPVDGEPQLRVLVLALLQVRHHLLGTRRRPPSCSSFPRTTACAQSDLLRPLSRPPHPPLGAPDTPALAQAGEGLPRAHTALYLGPGSHASSP